MSQSNLSRLISPRSIAVVGHRGADFYLKTDSLRRQRRFEKILIAFKELGVDVKPISEILVALKTINVSKLDKALIVEQIAQKRLSVIRRFLNPTK